MIDRTRTILGFAAGLLAATATADTITVCLDGTCDFTDPVAAAATAGSGDVIEIAAGTYPVDEPVVMYGPGFEIRGAVDGKGRPATILDGQGVGQVLAIILAVGETARVENLVITNGFAERGGGLWTRHSTLNFENCVISGNHAENKGGGMFVESSSFYPVTFEGCEFSGNTVSHPRFNIGLGGAGWLGESLVRLIDTEVVGNSAQHSGGGFGMGTEGELMLDGSRICGNDASDVPDTSQVSGGTITMVLGCIEESCDCLPVNPADLNRNGVVNGADLGFMLAAWGACAGCPADLNGDGFVNGADLGLLLAAWG